MNANRQASAPTLNLANQVAVVTGAGDGIGKAVAKLYAEASARLAVVDISAEHAERVASEINNAGGVAVGFRCDVGDESQVQKTAEMIVNRLGSADILVNNAGTAWPSPLHEITGEQWTSMFNVHVEGSLYWLQAVAPGMHAKGYGTIIFTTSASGILGTRNHMSYSAAKSAQLGMVRSAAREMAGSGITVNAVSPGAVTHMTESIQANEESRQKFLEEKAIKRWAQPDEIAGTYLFLASEYARYMTGQILSVDGGRVMTR